MPLGSTLLDLRSTPQSAVNCSQSALESKWLRISIMSIPTHPPPYSSSSKKPPLSPQMYPPHARGRVVMWAHTPHAPNMISVRQCARAGKFASAREDCKHPQRLQTRVVIANVRDNSRGARGIDRPKSRVTRAAMRARAMQARGMRARAMRARRCERGDDHDDDHDDNRDNDHDDNRDNDHDDNRDNDDADGVIKIRRHSRCIVVWVEKP